MHEISNMESVIIVNQTAEIHKYLNISVGFTQAKRSFRNFSERDNSTAFAQHKLRKYQVSNPRQQHN